MSVEPTVVFVDLDPRAIEDMLEAREELRRVPLLDEEHNTVVGTTMAVAEAEIMHAVIKKNVDLFVWTPSVMLGVSPNIITHKLLVFKEKTTFMTADANYYYEVMSFGLKNAEVTYLRLMDKIFQGLIGRCLEVKSDSFEQHVEDLK